MRAAKRALGAGLLGWLLYAAVAWLRYGKSRGVAASGKDPLDAFIPDPEVDEVHETHVSAKPADALEAAKRLDLKRSPLVCLIFALRGLPDLVRGIPVNWESPGLVEETQAIGWGVLEDAPGLYVSGAIAQPWHADVELRALAPEEFTSFDDPGFAKIVWTLEAEAIVRGGSIVRTRTRVKTTDPISRRRFRLYWAIFSPGILVIRYEALRLLRELD